MKKTIAFLLALLLLACSAAFAEEPGAFVPQLQDIQLQQGEVLYIITVTDENGGPIPGVWLTICNDEICSPVQTDDDGFCVFCGQAYPYTVHVLMAPDGYLTDPEAEFLLPEEGGQMIISLTPK